MPEEKTEKLEELLKKLGELGRDKNSKEILEKIDSLLELILETVGNLPAGKKPKAYSSIADVLIQIDMRDKAVETLDKIIGSIPGLEDPYEMALAYTETAGIQIKLNMKGYALTNLETAASLVGLKDDKYSQAMAFADIGELNTKAKESDEIEPFFKPSLDAAKDITNIVKQSDAYTKISEKQIDASNRKTGAARAKWIEAASKTLDMVLSAAEKLPPFSKDRACRKLSELYVNINKLKKVEKVIETAPYSKSWIKAYLASQYGYKGDFTEARRLTDSIKDDNYLSAWSYVRIADAKLSRKADANEEIKLAEENAEKITSPYSQAEIYKYLIGVYKRLKDDAKVYSSSESAKRSTEKIDDKVKQSERYIEIELADSSKKPDFKLAKNSAGEITDNYQRAEAYLKIAAIEKRYDVSAAKETLGLSMDAAQDIDDEAKKLEILLGITKEKNDINKKEEKTLSFEELAEKRLAEFFGE